MTAWGTAAFAPPDKVRLDDPYLSPTLHPFSAPVPIFVHAGGAEVIIDSIRGFADAMRQVAGIRIEYLETPNVPHDIYGGGHVAGWKKEQEDVVEAAAGFVRIVLSLIYEVGRRRRYDVIYPTTPPRKSSPNFFNST